MAAMITCMQKILHYKFVLNSAIHGAVEAKLYKHENAGCKKFHKIMHTTMSISPRVFVILKDYYIQ